jgi:CBS domain-containing protein
MSVGQFCIHEVVTVTPTTLVRVAAEHMAAKKVGALVVLDDGKPVGILTDRDLVVRAIARGYPPDLTEVRAVMTPNPICIAADAPLAGALERMQFYHIRRLVVVNDAQETVGIISLDDILELLAEERQTLAAVGEVMRAVRSEI